MDDVDCDYDKWQEAMELEMEFVYSNLVWKLLDLLEDAKSVVVNRSTRKRNELIEKSKLSKGLPKEKE